MIVSARSTVLCDYIILGFHLVVVRVISNYHMLTTSERVVNYSNLDLGLERLYGSGYHKYQLIQQHGGTEEKALVKQAPCQALSEPYFIMMRAVCVY